MNRSCLLTALCLLLSIQVGYAQDADNYGYGPIEITNQYILNTLHASWGPRSPEVLDKGQFAVKGSFAWTSSNATEEGSYRVDNENREGLFSFRYGLIDRGDVTVEVPLLWRGGGVLDSFIDGWHDFFGLPEGGRDRVGRDEYFVSGMNQDGSVFDLDDDGLSLGNIRSRFSYEITKGDESSPAVTFEFGVSLPTSQSQFGHRGLDLSAGILASKRYGDFIFYGGAALFYYDDTSIANVSYAPIHNEDFVAVEWQFWDRLAAQVALTYSTETVQDISQHADYSLYLDTGLTYQYDENLLIDATVRENPAEGDSSADVTFLLALRYIS